MTASTTTDQPIISIDFRNFAANFSPPHAANFATSKKRAKRETNAVMTKGKNAICITPEQRVNTL